MHGDYAHSLPHLLGKCSSWAFEELEDILVVQFHQHAGDLARTDGLPQFQHPREDELSQPLLSHCGLLRRESGLREAEVGLQVNPSRSWRSRRRRGSWLTFRRRGNRRLGGHGGSSSRWPLDL